MTGTLVGTMAGIVIGGAALDAGSARAEVPQHECDKQASHPVDPNRKAPGRKIADVGFGAIVTCALAVGLYPDEPRFAYLLGRANLAMGNAEEANKHIRSAAERGYAIAQYQFARNYKEGRGIAKNQVEARRWYIASAKQGFSHGLYFAGIYLERGIGGPKDLRGARSYFDLARKAGHPNGEEGVDRVSAQLGPVTAPPAQAPAQVIAPSQELVLTMQTLLNQLGYDAGTPDGKMGRKTRNAITSFETSQGLATTAAPSASLRDRLFAALSAGLKAPAAAQPASRVAALDQFTVTRDAAISGHNSRHLTKVSAAACAEACLAETGFVCKSFDYYKNERKCDLSESALEDVGKLSRGATSYDHYSREFGATAAAPAVLPAAPRAPVAPPRPAQPLPAPAQPVAVVALAAARADVPEGEAIEVQYSGLPARGQDWLALAAPDHADDQYYDLIMLEAKPAAGSHAFKIVPPGDYEVRAFTDWPKGGYQVRARVAVTVTAAPKGPALTVEGQPVSAEQTFNVAFAGLPAEGQNWLSVALPDHAPDQYYLFKMLTVGKTRGSATFDGLPANTYEARAFGGWPEAGYEIIARTPVVVGNGAPAPQAAPAPAPKAAAPRPSAPPVPQPTQPAAAVESFPDIDMQFGLDKERYQPRDEVTITMTGNFPEERTSLYVALLVPGTQADCYQIAARSADGAETTGAGDAKAGIVAKVLAPRKGGDYEIRACWSHKGSVRMVGQGSLTVTSVAGPVTLAVTCREKTPVFHSSRGSRPGCEKLKGDHTLPVGNATVVCKGGKSLWLARDGKSLRLCILAHAQVLANQDIRLKCEASSTASFYPTGEVSLCKLAEPARLLFRAKPYVCQAGGKIRFKRGRVDMIYDAKYFKFCKPA